MIQHTEYYDFDPDAFEQGRTPEKPPWWNPELKRCGCGYDHMNCVASYAMPSDGALLLMECGKCRTYWCESFEG